MRSPRAGTFHQVTHLQVDAKYLLPRCREIVPVQQPRERKLVAEAIQGMQILLPLVAVDILERYSTPTPAKVPGNPIHAMS